MIPAAETLLRQMICAIEANRTADGRSFYPEKVFDALPSSWLAHAKKSIEWSAEDDRAAKAGDAQ